jgi:hypothetical protein
MSGSTRPDVQTVGVAASRRVCWACGLYLKARNVARPTKRNRMHQPWKARMVLTSQTLCPPTAFNSVQAERLAWSLPLHWPYLRSFICPNIKDDIVCISNRTHRWTHFGTDLTSQVKGDEPSPSTFSIEAQNPRHVDFGFDKLQYAILCCAWKARE